MKKEFMSAMPMTDVDLLYWHTKEKNEKEKNGIMEDLLELDSVMKEKGLTVVLWAYFGTKRNPLRYFTIRGLIDFYTKGRARTKREHDAIMHSTFMIVSIDYFEYLKTTYYIAKGENE